MKQLMLNLLKNTSSRIQKKVNDLFNNYKDNSTLRIKHLEIAVKEVDDYVNNGTILNTTNILNGLNVLSHLIADLNYEVKHYEKIEYILSLFFNLTNSSPSSSSSSSSPSQPNQKIIVYPDPKLLKKLKQLIDEAKTKSDTPGQCNTKCSLNIDNKCRAYTDITKCNRRS